MRPLAGHASDVRRLVLWRHGRTEWNRLGIAQGHADVCLDEVGAAQARQAAPYLASYRPAFVWSSDSARARETAQRLVELTGGPLRLDSRLREYDVGARQGMTREQYAAAFPDAYAAQAAGRETVRVPGAETTPQVASRMVAVLREAADAVAAGETGVLVGHGASLRTGVLAFFGVPLQLSEMLAGMSNCAWSVLQDHPTYGWQIVDYNARTLPEPVDLADEPAGR